MADYTLHYNPTTLRRDLNKQYDRQREVAAEVQKYANGEKQYAGLGLLDSFHNAYPVLEGQRIHDILLSDEAKLFKGVAKVQGKSKNAVNPATANVYAQLHNRAFKYLTTNVSTGSELMHKVRDLNNELTYAFNSKTSSYRNWADVRSSYEYYKAGHGVSVFDLETLGGENVYGKNHIAKIQEFFMYNQSTNKTYQGIVGISQKEYEYYQEALRNFGNEGLQGDLNVVAKRFALLGREETVIEEDPKAKGRFVTKAFVDPNAEGLMTRENIMSGLDRARHIGLMQELTADKTTGLMTWEKDYIDGLLDLQNNGTSVLSHNGTRFDAQMINQDAAQNWSAAAKKYAQAKGWQGALKIDPIRNLDTLPILQYASTHQEFLDKLYPGGNKQILKDGHLTALTQEGLINSLIPDYYERVNMGAHTAGADSMGLLELITNGKVDGENFLDAVFNMGASEQINSIESKIKSGNQQLFLSTGAFGPSDFARENLFGFAVDPYSGKILTNDGFELGEQGAKGTLPEWLTKKGVSYSVSEIQQLKANDEYVELMRKTNPALAVEDLVMMRLHPEVNDKYNGMVAKSDIDSYIIGTQDDVKSWMSNNMLHYADKQNDGWKLKSGAKNLIQKHEYVKDEKTGKVSLKPIEMSESDLVASTIEDGSFIQFNDSAARMIRQDSFKKYKALDRLAQEVEKATLQGGDKNVVLKNFVEAAHKTADAVANNRPIDLGEQKGLVNDMATWIGYAEKGKQPTFNRKTIDNIIASFDYYESIAPTVQHVMNRVEEMAKGHPDEAKYKEFLFKKSMEAVRAKALEDAQQTNFDMTDGYVRGYAKDYFEVDVNGLYDTKKGTPIAKAAENVNLDDVLKINLKSNSEYTLVSNLMKRANLAPGKVNYNVEAMKQLHKFVNHVHKNTGMLSGVFGEMDGADEDFFVVHDPNTFAKKIVNELRSVREQDDTAGYLNINKVHKVTGESEMKNMVTADLDKTLDEALKNINPDSFRTVARGASKEAKDARRSMASDIAKNFLMDPFDVTDLQKYYTDTQIDALQSIHKAAAEDYTTMVEQLLESVAETDTGVLYDKKNNLFGLMTDSGEYVDLKYTPRFRYKNGMFYNQVGRSKFEVGLTLGIDKRVKNNANRALGSGDVKYRTNLGNALDEVWNLKYQVNSAIDKNQDYTQKIKSWIGGIAEQIRSSSSVDMLDQQDAKKQFEVKVADLIDMLPRYEQQGLFKDLDLKYKDELTARIKRPGFSFKTMNDTDKMLWALNQAPMLQRIAQHTANEKIMNLVGKINPRGKSSSFEEGKLRFDSIADGFDYFNKSARDIENQTARALGFRESVARARMKALGIEDEVVIGGHVKTKFGHAYNARQLEGTLDKVRTSITTSRRALSSRQYRTELSNYAKIIEASNDSPEVKKAKLKAIQAAKLTGNVTEGGAVANARLADAIFHAYDMQKISFEKQLHFDHSSNVDMIKQINKKYGNILPQIQFNSDGTLGNLRYNKGKFVRRFDELFTLEGHGGPEAVGAKYDGALRFGFFTQGGSTLATEEEVMQTVQKYAADNGLKINNRDDFMRHASRFYDASFYVEKLQAGTYRKMAEDRLEKHLTTYLYGGLGEYDKRVAKALEGMGLGHLQNKVLSYDFFEELSNADKFHKGVLRESTSHKKGIGKKGYEKAVKEAGFKDVEEFRKALAWERYLPSDVVKKAIGANIALGDDAIKHGSLMAPVMAGINELVKKNMDEGMSEEQAKKATHNMIQHAFVKDGVAGKGLLFKDGEMVLQDLPHNKDNYVHYDKLSKIFGDVLGDKWTKIMQPGQVTQHEFNLQQDFTGTTSSNDMTKKGISETEKALSKGAKITDREMNMIEFQRYDQNTINELKGALSPEEFNKTFGHVLDSEGKLKAEDDGRAIMKSFTDDIRKSVYYKPGEKLLTDSKLATKKYGFLKSTVDALKKQGVKEVGEKSAEQVYAASMGYLASNWNTGKIEDMKRMERNNFSKISLSQVEQATGGDANYLFNENLHSKFGRNVMVDLQDNVLTSDILDKAGLKSRYLAINHMPMKRFGDSVVLDAPHKQLSLITKYRNDLEQALGEKADTREVEYHRNKLIGALKDFTQIQAGAITGKDGLVRNVSEIRLDKSVSGKASLLHVDNVKDLDKFGINPEALGKMRFGGKSLAELHKSRVHVDFKILSEDSLASMGMFEEDYMKSAGVKDKAEMLKKLATEGVTGFSHRHPTVYEGSYRPVQIYYNQAVKGNQSIEYAAGLLRGKGDADGDMPKTIVARFDDGHGNKLDYLQMQKAIEDGKVTKEAMNGFNDIHAAMYKAAVGANRFYQDELDKDVDKMEKMDKYISDELAKRYSTDGKMRATFDKYVSPEDMKEHTTRYNEVHGKALERRTQELIKDEGMSALEARTAAHNDFEKNLYKHTKYLSDEIGKMSQSQKAAYHNSIQLHMQNELALATTMSKFKKGSAGEIDLPIYQMDKLRTMAFEQKGLLTGEEQKYLRTVYEATVESFLSPKHSEARIINNAMQMHDFNAAIRAVSGNPLPGHEAGTGLLTDYFMKNLKGRIRPEGLVDKEGKPLADEVIAAGGARAVSKLLNATEGANKFNTYLNVLGARKNGILAEQINDARIMPKEDHSMLKSTMSAIGEISGLGSDSTSSIFKERLTRAKQRPLHAAFHEAEEESIGDLAGSLMKGLHKEFGRHNLSGRNLAMGALGIAGASMIAGIVGGNPTKPPETQANEMADEENYYQIPQLADTNLINQKPGVNSGYVININAQTSRGKDHAQQAIRQAVSNGFGNANVNVAMNIRDNQSNITDGSILNAIKGAIA